MNPLNWISKEYTIQYHLTHLEEGIEAERMYVRASNHKVARKRAEKTLRKNHGRHYEIEWIQRY